MNRGCLYVSDLWEGGRAGGREGERARGREIDDPCEETVTFVTLPRAMLSHPLFGETQMRVRSYRDLGVWQKSVDFIDEVYRLTRQFPADERFALTAQVRKASVSVASNIAEG